MAQGGPPEALPSPSPILAHQLQSHIHCSCCSSSNGTIVLSGRRYSEMFKQKIPSSSKASSPRGNRLQSGRRSSHPGVLIGNHGSGWSSWTKNGISASEDASTSSQPRAVFAHASDHSRSQPWMQLVQDEVTEASSPGLNATPPESPDDPKEEILAKSIAAESNPIQLLPAFETRDRYLDINSDGRTMSVFTRGIHLSSSSIPRSLLSVSPRPPETNTLFCTALSPDIVPPYAPNDIRVFSINNLQNSKRRLDEAAQLLLRSQHPNNGVSALNSAFTEASSGTVHPLLQSSRFSANSRASTSPSPPSTSSLPATPRRSRISRAFSSSHTPSSNVPTPRLSSPRSPHSPGSPSTTRRWQSALHAILSPSPSLPRSFSPSAQSDPDMLAFSQAANRSDFQQVEIIKATDTVRRAQSDLLDAVRDFGNLQLGLQLDSKQLRE